MKKVINRKTKLNDFYIFADLSMRLCMEPSKQVSVQSQQ